MAPRGKWLIAAMLVAAAPLGACRDNPVAKSDLKPIDGDSASAADDEIIVDPQRGGRSKARPVGSGRKATLAEANAALRQGKLLTAPEPLPMEAACENCGEAKPVTIGELAREQSNGRCDAKLSYDKSWAERLPKGIRLYPKATLREAAGIDGGKCNLRVVNFQTAEPLQRVLNYYHTLAIRAGYSSDHRLNGNEHLLGGTKGEMAYVVFARREGAVTDVDLVASGGI